MASLRDVVSEYQDDLRNGIAWLAFWREGRSWQAEAFHLDLDDTLYPEDRARLAEIQAADPRAVVVNGYYSGYLSEEMSVAELAAGVRHHYDNGLNNIAPFMEAHSDELPPDVLEAAREKAHAAGLPFYERPYRGDDIDPYTYDGHMSIEDYELMQKLMEQDRERSEPMSEVFSILLHNRQRYEQGKEGLWFSLPTTTEKLQAALREIGISADNPQDFFLYGYRSPQERPIKLPRDLVLSADVDELNFLAARLEKLDAAELAELNAALTSPQSDFHSIGQIIDYPDNVDYYVHLPDVTGTGQLGDYYLNRSGMVDMPEEWKAGIFLPRFGLHIANTEHGVFTDYGYGYKKDPENKKRWIVDEEAAAVVQKIFALCMDGMGPTQIAKWLQENKVLSPVAYCYENDLPTTSKRPTDPYKWATKTVVHILERLDYLGHTVNFKTSKQSFKSKKVLWNDPADWVIFENTQEPIIEESVFLIVQKIRQGRRRPTKMGDMGMFSGLLFCADCGGKMYLCRANHFKPEQEYYLCSTYRKDRTLCSTHSIRRVVLEEIVLRNLREAIQYVTQYEDDFVQRAADQSLRERDKELAQKKDTLAQSQKRIAELDVIIKRLYEDNISGKLSDERFIKLSRDYELEQTNLTNLVEHLRQEVKEQEKQKVNVRQFIAAVRKYTDMQQLDASILREFVDKIYISEVYTPDENEPRIKVREIEIVYNFIGAFDFEEAREQSQAAQKEKKTGVA